MKFARRIRSLVPLLAAAWAPGAAAQDAGWTVHAQSTVIEQWHYGFPAEYSGANSLESSTTEDKHTITATVFLGRALWPGAALYYDPEETEGNGLSSAVGVAGFPNGEATRAGSNSLVYDTARLYLQQTIPLGPGEISLDDDQNQLARHVAADRLDLYAGRFAVVDLFDDNAYSHDPRTQFLNWALMDSGAWDYPADTKGYTDGFSAVLTHPSWTLSYGVFMEPREANGFPLDPHVAEAHGQILEFDQSYTWNGRHGTVRPFLFWNQAHMGNYALAIEDSPGDPNLAPTRAYRSKAGAGLSWDQEISANAGVFVRGSWNNGRTETWAFTEIDRSLAAGFSTNGSAWSRKEDTAAIAVVGDGLSSLHREYLADRGYGFIIGDGRLNYGPEEILETYYSWKALRWLWLTPDYQYVEHPAYNRDRGGVSIYAVRAHLQF